MYCTVRALLLVPLLTGLALAADVPPAGPPPEKKPAAKAESPKTEASKPEALEKRIQELIRQLGDKDYFVRQRAQNDLLAIGVDALDALMEAKQSSESLEIATRADYLLKMMRVVWTDRNDPAEVKRLLGDYEKQPKLKSLLEKHYPLLVNEDDLLIFDLKARK